MAAALLPLRDNDAVTAPRALKLNARDNVAVALVKLDAGEPVSLTDEEPIVVPGPIPAGHKFAVAALASGEPVIKYGDVIGILTSSVAPGDHVHVHNVVSARLPGPGGGR